MWRDAWTGRPPSPKKAVLLIKQRHADTVPLMTGVSILKEKEKSLDQSRVNTFLDSFFTSRIGTELRGGQDDRGLHKTTGFFLVHTTLRSRVGE